MSEDEDWDIQAEAIVLDSDHTIDESTIEKLQDEMLEAIFVPAQDPPEGGEKT